MLTAPLASRRAGLSHSAVLDRQHQTPAHYAQAHQGARADRASRPGVRSSFIASVLAAFPDMLRSLTLCLSFLVASLATEYGLAESMQSFALDKTQKPYAEWVVLPKSQSRFASSLYRYQSRFVPNNIDVNVPAYPRSRLLMIDEEQIRTRQDNPSHSEKRTLMLASTDTIGKVIEWYSRRLTDYLLHKEENRSLFLQGDNEEMQKIGARAMNCTQYVVVKDLAEPFQRAMPGFNALIEISYYPASRSISDTGDRLKGCK